MEDLDITSTGETSETSSSPEAIREKSEKQKESYKKAQIQIQRAQKDEKKAKQDNDELFYILMRFIQNPYYESLIPCVIQLLTITVPSRPIIGMLALVYPDAAHHLFHVIGQGERIHLLKNLFRYEEVWIFDEKYLHESIRQWMSVWIDSFNRYATSEGSSILMQKKFVSLTVASESTILVAITELVVFFFTSRNINIPLATSESYSRFILKNIRSTLEKSIQENPNKDIAADHTIVDSKLFGL